MVQFDIMSSMFYLIFDHGTEDTEAQDGIEISQSLVFGLMKLIQRETPKAIIIIKSQLIQSSRQPEGEGLE